MMSLSEIRGLAAAVDAADRAGILAAISAQAKTTVELAGELGIDPLATDCVLAVLESWDLVARDGGRCRLTARTRRELEGPEGHPGGNKWERTADFLRRGSHASMLARAPRGEAYAAVVARLSRWFEPAASRLAEHLLMALGGIPEPRILDVGAGGGIWSLALLERSTSARVTALDLAPVLPAYEAAAVARGLHRRVDMLEGDYHRLELTRHRYHVVLAANVLHLEQPGDANTLVARLGNAVAPGGVFAIVDMLSDGSRDEEKSRAIYALNLALRIPMAQPHREETLRDWLGRAGFPRVQRTRLSEDIRGVSALIARREEPWP